MTTPHRVAIDCRKIADYGIGTYVRNLVSALANLEGEEELVLILRSDDAAFVPSHPRFSGVTCDAPNYSARELIAVGRLLERERVDLFHAPHYVVPFTRRPFVVTIHDLIHLRAPAPWLPAGARLYARWMIRRAARNAAAVIVPTNAVRADLDAEMSGSVRDVAVVSLGVDPAFLRQPGPAARDVLSRCGLESRPFVLYAGNDKPHKNLDRLLGAWRLARAAARGARLVLVGLPGERVVDEDDVIATGWTSTEELVALVRAARVVVLPSLFEGFGLPLVEAMACGTPAIASDIPALVEVSAGAALHVDPMSERSIANAIVAVLSDDDLRAALSDAGRGRAAHFSWTKTAERTLAIYREALKNRAKN